jgi:hypothetical protein
MRNTMNVTEYKVVGVYGAADNTYTIAAWDTLEEARGHSNAIILNDCIVGNMRYTSIEIVKVSEERVDIFDKPTPKLFAPDYERQGVAPKAVEVVDPKDFREMVEILRNLEDRFVGLRNGVMLDLGDVMLDLEAMQEDVDDLKDDAMATESEICALDDELADHRNQLYALRFTVDALECELESE